ncbi:MAG: cytochrome c3 family protein [Planctomycetota bacterium]|nr:cytochrome c3 family protein [Planctomycetota bacterium]
MFPKWMNLFPTVSAVAGLLGTCTIIGGFWYYATPKFFRVGYMPTQPGGGFSHQLHAGKLGMDCRYCHTKVEESAEANIPNVATCVGCHAEDRLTLFQTSDTHKALTQFVRDAYAADQPIAWARVHKLPDYVRNFPHQVHLQAGVSCFSCHGRIDQMPIVYHAEPLSMGWCLECHREPEASLVPREQVTNLNWVEEHLAQRQSGAAGAVTTGKQLLDSLRNAPPENCGACHY